MARGRKAGPTRMDLRRQSEAAEANEEEEIVEEEVDDDEAEESEEEEVDDEEVVKPVKKVKKVAVRKPRAVKEVRTRAIWVVLDNAGKRVKEFPYPQKAEAEALVEEKTEEKKSTFYIQLVKEALVEPKEK